MNITMLSLDQSLVTRSGYGDTLERLSQYAKHLKRLDIFIPTQIHARPWSAGNIHCYPVCSKIKLFSYLKLIATILNHHKHHPIDLVTTNDAVLGFTAIAASTQVDVPVLINVFGSYLTKPNIKPSPLNIVRKIALNHTDFIRTDTQRDKSAIENMLHIPAENIIVEPVPPAPSAQQKLISIAKDRKEKPITHILTVATLNKNKNIPLLLHAISQLRDTNLQFTLIGSGPRKSQIQAQIHALGIPDKITLHPNVSYKELLHHYRTADAFILPSNHEGFPRVLMEAALAKLPIISTRTSGALEFFTHQKHATLIPIGEPKALVKAIHTFTTSPAIAHDYATAAQKHAVNTLNFKDHEKRILGIWQKASQQSS